MCDTCFYFLTKQASQFICVEIPRRHQDRWCFPRLIAAHIFSPCRTPECYFIIIWLHWNGSGTNLKSERSLRTIFRNYEAGPDIFTLTSVFWRFPLAFEYLSLFFLSVISAAKPTACSLCSASNIYGEHEQPGFVKGMWSLGRIGRDSTQSDIVADRWCKSLIPFLAS